MAGSGDLTSVGWQHALNASVGSAISSASGIGPPGDLVGTLSSAASAGVVTTLTCSAGTLKALPSGALLMIVDAAGTLSTMELVMLTSAYASGTTTAMSITSQTLKYTHAIGAFLYLVGFSPFLALMTSTPTQTALGTEYAATGYSRQAVAQTATTTSSNPSVANAALITFGPFSTGTGAAVTCGEIMDASSGGTALNAYAYFTWGTSKTPGSGDSLQVAIAALSLAGS
jgi:hypothetical protein